MSLHKFADMVAKQGRGEDSLLIHMTPDEVQRLQQFAQANGRSLTINPTTGLPEAGMLSDLFKAVAPIALGAFLGPAGVAFGGPGLSAAMAGVATGGITTLATGSLSRGLMAGLGAYGGAGLGESLMGAGTGALEAGAASAAQGQLGAANLALGEAMPAQAAQQFTQDAVARQMAAATPFDKMSAGLGSAASTPMQFAKDNFKYLGAAAAPIMAGAMVPTTTKMPTETNPAYIRQKLYDPYTQTYKTLAPVKASEFGNRSFSDAYTNPQTGEMATLQPRAPSGFAGGGIVALANGGIPGYADGALVNDQQIFDYFAAGPKTDEQIARDMGTFNVTAADIARATGTQDRVSEYENRYTAADTNNDIYDYFAKPETQALLTSGNDAAIAQALQANDWSLANVAAATGTTGQLGDYATRYVNAVSTPTTSATEFLNYAADVGLTGQNLVNALQNSGMSAAAQYALMNAMPDTNTGGIAGTDFYKQIGYTTGALPGDMGGIEGLYANINYSAKGLQDLVDSGKITVAQAQALAEKEAGRVGVSGKDIKSATGKSLDDLFKPKKDEPLKPPPLPPLKPPPLPPPPPPPPKPDPFVSVVPGGTKLPGATTYANGAYGNYGTGNKTGVDYLGRTVSIATPGDIITNTDGTRTIVPNLPGRPYGGFSGMDEVKSAYTAGGGSLGYTSKAPKTVEEFEQLYNKQTGDSLAAYDYLMGKGAGTSSPARYPTQSVAANSATGIMRPYFSAGMKYKPKFLAYNKDGTIKSSETSGSASETGEKTGSSTPSKTINVLDNQGNTETATLREDGKYYTSGGNAYDESGAQIVAGGGMMGYAMGGGLGSLGSYSDGGRLLRGPGDGVSDSIPATIGRKQQPARLADGEFVIPARIVSELGNGSTDAGAKKLYAMMDRVQRARGKTTGKNKVAANSRADKHLPA